MMIHVSDQSRYLLFCGETDMRKSFHGLSALVKYHMKCDVQNGDVYVFISRRRSSIKLLRFEGYGFAIFYKHLEKGTFEMPKQEGFIPIQMSESASSIFAEIQWHEKIVIRLFQKVDAEYLKALSL